jgi:hypothetical protein
MEEKKHRAITQTLSEFEAYLSQAWTIRKAANNNGS